MGGARAYAHAKGPTAAPGHGSLAARGVADGRPPEATATSARPTTATRREITGSTTNITSGRAGCASGAAQGRTPEAPASFATGSKHGSRRMGHQSQRCPPTARSQ